MDWTVCPRCGLRYVPTVPACPGCGDLAAASQLAHRRARQQLAARPRRDLVIVTLHLAMAGSVLWTVARFERPLWALALAALELAIAAAAFGRWRSKGILVLVRTAVFAVAAAVLAEAELVNSFLFAVILGHAIAVLAAHRDPAADVSFLGGAFSGLRPAATVQDRAVRDRADADVRYFARMATLVPAVATWLLLASILEDVARAG